MSDSFLAYQNPTTTDKKLDSESLVVGANTVERERIQISGSAATAIADVITTDPTAATPGMVVREVNSTVIAGLINIGNANTTAIVSRLGSTIFVQLDPGHLLGSVTANAGTGTFSVQFDPGHELGSLKGINNSIAVHVLSTGGTIVTKIDPAGFVFTNNASTASIFTISGSTSGISVSGVQLIAPSANYSFKVYAYSLKTTGVVSLTTKFTNGAGTSPTEFWRPLVTAGTPTGENAFIPPPSFLFATGTSTTLALVLDTASLVHYSISYIKETV